MSMLLLLIGFLPATALQSHQDAIVTPTLGETAKLSPKGYLSVAELKDDAEMRKFVDRLLVSRKKYATDEGMLNGLIPWFSGTRAQQTFDALHKELDHKPWVKALDNATADAKTNATAARVEQASPAQPAAAQSLLSASPSDSAAPVEPRVGVYRISFPNGVPVSEKQARNSSQVAVLREGEIVHIVEIGNVVEKRLRARVSNPAGWISLRHVDFAADFAEFVGELPKQCLVYCSLHKMSWAAKCGWVSNDCSGCSPCSEGNSSQLVVAEPSSSSPSEKKPDGSLAAASSDSAPALNSSSSQSKTEQKSAVTERSLSWIASKARENASPSTLAFALKVDKPVFVMSGLLRLKEEYQQKLFDTLGKDAMVVLQAHEGVARVLSITDVEEIIGFRKTSGDKSQKELHKMLTSRGAKCSNCTKEEMATRVEETWNWRGEDKKHEKANATNLMESILTVPFRRGNHHHNGTAKASKVQNATSKASKAVQSLKAKGEALKKVERDGTASGELKEMERPTSAPKSRTRSVSFNGPKSVRPTSFLLHDAKPAELKEAHKDLNVAVKSKKKHATVENATVMAKKGHTSTLENATAKSKRTHVAKMDVTTNAKKKHATTTESATPKSKKGHTATVENTTAKAKKTRVASLENATAQSKKTHVAKLENATAKSKKTHAAKLENITAKAKKTHALKLENVTAKAKKTHVATLEDAAAKSKQKHASTVENAKLKSTRKHAAKLEDATAKAKKTHVARLEDVTAKAKKTHVATLEDAAAKSKQKHASTVGNAKLKSTRKHAAKLEDATAKAKKTHVARLEDATAKSKKRHHASSEDVTARPTVSPSVALKKGGESMTELYRRAAAAKLEEVEKDMAEKLAEPEQNRTEQNKTAPDDLAEPKHSKTEQNSTALEKLFDSRQNTPEENHTKSEESAESEHNKTEQNSAAFDQLDDSAQSTAEQNQAEPEELAESEQNEAEQKDTTSEKLKVSAQSRTEPNETAPEKPAASEHNQAEQTGAASDELEESEQYRAEPEEEKTARKTMPAKVQAHTRAKATSENVEETTQTTEKETEPSEDEAESTLVETVEDTVVDAVSNVESAVHSWFSKMSDWVGGLSKPEKEKKTAKAAIKKPFAWKNADALSNHADTGATASKKGAHAHARRAEAKRQAHADDDKHANEHVDAHATKLLSRKARHADASKTKTKTKHAHQAAKKAKHSSDKPVTAQPAEDMEHDGAEQHGATKTIAQAKDENTLVASKGGRIAQPNEEKGGRDAQPKEENAFVAPKASRLPEVSTLVEKHSEVMSTLSEQLARMKAEIADAEAADRRYALEKKAEYEKNLTSQQADIRALEVANSKLSIEVKGLTKQNSELRQRAKHLQAYGEELREDLNGLMVNLSTADEYAADTISASQHGVENLQVLRELEEKEDAERAVQEHNKQLSVVAGQGLDDEQSDGELAMLQLGSRTTAHENDETDDRQASHAAMFDMIGALQEHWGSLDTNVDDALHRLELEFLANYNTTVARKRALEDEGAHLRDRKEAQLTLRTRLTAAVDHLKDTTDTLEKRVSGLRSFFIRMAGNVQYDDVQEIKKESTDAPIKKHTRTKTAALREHGHSDSLKDQLVQKKHH